MKGFKKEAILWTLENVLFSEFKTAGKSIFRISALKGASCLEIESIIDEAFLTRLTHWKHTGCFLLPRINL